MLITREFPMSLEVEGDGRTLVGMVAPYNKVTVVHDRGPDGRLSKPYREAIERGAFRKVAKAPNRVALRLTHDAGPFADVGRAVTLREAEDGLYAELRVDRSPFGEHALEKYLSGQFTGLSVGAAVLRSREDGDVTWRTLLALDHVALVERAAYAEAKVLSLRERAPMLHAWLVKYPLPSGAEPHHNGR